MFFKELFAATEAVTRALQALVDVFNPPTTPTWYTELVEVTTPRMLLKRE